MIFKQALLIIQYITIIGLFLEIVIVIRRCTSKLHIYLLLNCLATLVSNIGYLCEMNAPTEEAYYVALKFSYAGRVWVAFTLFLFVLELCKVRLPALVRDVLVGVHLFTYVLVLTIQKHDLYYTDTKFRYVINGIFPKLFHKNGIWYNIHMVIQIGYIVLGLILLFRSLYREKNRTAKKRIVVVLCAIIAESFFYIVMMIGIPGLTNVYDVTMLGYFIGTMFMLIAIISFDLLGTKEIAREFVIDRISEGIIAVDRDGMVQYANEPAKELFPTLKDEGRELPEEVGRAVESDENISLKGHIYRPEINELLYQGNNYGKLYAFVDETDHIRYMEELEEQKEIADNANQAKSRFLASMSHEIRTPINAVLGLDEMILRESTEKEIRSYAADIQSSGKTLLSLINDILDLSKVEEGKMEIIPVQYELSSLINDLVNMVRDRADRKGLALILEVDKETPHLLCGDEIRIRQCVLNLLTNAVKYTETGSVTLKVYSEKKDDQRISLGFAVTDTGIGMKQEDLDKLFSPYQRIEEKRNRTIEGTGLGMSITRQLLDLMGSSLVVKSEYGRGSVFSFTVIQDVINWEEIGEFAERFDDEKADACEYHALFFAPEARILVVDDTEMNLTVMQSLLKQTGILVDTALSGREALALSEETAYDAVFIDHMMPDMDGIETLQRIRENDRNANTPAIALTANAVSGAREMYLEAGFTDYISKPVKGIRLEKLLLSLLPPEKLHEVETGTQTASLKEDASLPEWLLNVPGLDTERGLDNCGSAEGYQNVLTVFHQTAGDKTEEIETLHREADLANYTIKVHALKSSARIIGATELSKLAEALETAGKEADKDFIEAHHDELLSLYRDFDRALAPLDQQTDALEEIDPAAMKEAYQTMTEIAGSMDYGLMESLLKEVRSYRLSEKDETNIKTIEDLLNRLDWDGLRDMAARACSEA